MFGAHLVEKDFSLLRPDGVELPAYRWGDQHGARAVLVFSHGMGEHARRYPPALALLAARGFLLYGLDHRGHGGNLEKQDAIPGDFGTGGFDALVADLEALVRRAVDENPGLPIALLGHSMGSFVVQAFLLDHSDSIGAAVLVGTCALDTLAAGVMREPDVGAALNRDFEPSRTPFDWLSRDEKEVDLYLNDPLCGFSLAPPSMMALLSQGERLASRNMLGRIAPQLPVLIVVGEADPLGAHLGSVAPLVDRYRKVGLKVDLASYPGGRHEILNEINRDEVMEQLADWLERTLIAADRD